jgi:RIO kinase 1
LAAVRPARDRLVGYLEQVREILGALARAGAAHGDLSPYNVLAAGDRLVVIDLPQVVDLVANPRGTELLLRDCRNLAAWFRRRGLPVDDEELFAEAVAQAY